MRIALFVVFCLGYRNVFAHASSDISTSTFNCEELSSHVQNLKETAKSKKDKFSCILNLLKSALSDEIENVECQEIIEDIPEEVNEDKINDDTYQVVLEKEKGYDKNFVENGKLVDETTNDTTNECINNTKNPKVPSMIPIFKPRPRNDLNPARPRTIPVSPQSVYPNSNPLSSVPKFTIPCQRAADVLDMSNLASPREVIEKKIEKAVQTNLKPTAPAPSSVLANQIPTKVFVHNANSEEAVSISFKPKTISLIQLYGNLLKKITITVLIPYHMSKLGQQ